MVKNLSKSIKNLVISCILIYVIIGLFLGIQEANKMVINIIHAFKF